MTQLINNVHETGEWPENFTEVKIIALKTNKKVAKCSNHLTVSLIAHTEKQY
jgi:hypothetical protein